MPTVLQSRLHHVWLHALAVSADVAEVSVGRTETVIALYNDSYVVRCYCCYTEQVAV